MFWKKKKKVFKPRLITKNQLELTLKKVMMHVKLQRDRRQGQLNKKEQQFVKLICKKVRNQKDEYIKGTSIVSDQCFIDACNICLRFIDILMDKSINIVESRGDPMRIEELKPYLISVLWVGKPLNIPVFGELYNLFAGFYGPGIKVMIEKEEVVDGELIQLFRNLMPTPNEVNLYFRKFCDNKQIKVEKFNEVGHNAPCHDLINKPSYPGTSFGQQGNQGQGQGNQGGFGGNQGNQGFGGNQGGQGGFGGGMQQQQPQNFQPQYQLPMQNQQLNLNQQPQFGQQQQGQQQPQFPLPQQNNQQQNFGQQQPQFPPSQPQNQQQNFGQQQPQFPPSQPNNQFQPQQQQQQQPQQPVNFFKQSTTFQPIQQQQPQPVVQDNFNTDDFGLEKFDDAPQKFNDVPQQPQQGNQYQDQDINDLLNSINSNNQQNNQYPEINQMQQSKPYQPNQPPQFPPHN